MSGPFYIDASEEIGSSFSSRERKRVATREEEFFATIALSVGGPRNRMGGEGRKRAYYGRE